MKGDWDKLAHDYENHPIALIAEVDCTADEGQPICDDFDVQVRDVSFLTRLARLPLFILALLFNT